MNTITDTSLLAMSTRAQISLMFVIVKKLNNIGADQLQLQSCKIQNNIFYWKLDGDLGYLAIDPVLRILYCTDQNLSKSEFCYRGFFDHARDIVTALDYLRFSFNRNTGLAANTSSPHRLDHKGDERCVILAKFVRNSARELLEYSTPKGVLETHLVSSALYIKQDDSFIVIRPDKDDWLGESVDLDPDSFQPLSRTFSRLVSLRDLVKSILGLQ